MAYTPEQMAATEEVLREELAEQKLEMGITNPFALMPLVRLLRQEEDEVSTASGASTVAR